ncbi:hypothetical protein [Aeromonas enteropelogenes]
MQIENGKVEGDVEISSDFKMHGIYAGNVTVKSGGYLTLYGLITKNLTIE